MKKRALQNLALCILLPLIYALGCSNSAPTTPKRLGTFAVFFDQDTKTVSIREGFRQSVERFSIKSSFDSSRASLGWDESVLNNQGIVELLECAPANWNDVTDVWSFNFKVKNISGTVATTDEILQPIEVRVIALTAQGVANPTTSDAVANVVQQINSNIATHPTQGCNNPISLSTCDDGAISGVAGNGILDIMWPDELADIDPIEYENDPGLDFSLKLGADNTLSDGEESSCGFIQFDINPSNVQSFIAWFDVFGVAASGVAFAAPAVSVNPASPTNDIDPELTITLTGGADRVRVTGGTNESTCINGDPCDLDGSGANSSVTLAYTLNSNTSNSVSVFQGNGAAESSATVQTIVHDNVSPVLTSSSPLNNSSGISPATNVLLTFDGALEAGSVIDGTTVLLNRDGGSSDCSSFGAGVNITVTQPSSSLILINPDSDLLSTEIYCARAVGLVSTCDGTNEIRDAAGNCLATTQVIQFETASSDSANPLILANVPVDSASDVSLNATVQVVFNEAMNATTVENALYFTVNDGASNISGTRALSVDGKTVTFTPSANFAASTEFTVTITTDVTDLAGNNLAANHVFTFTTGNAADVTGPTIVEFLPTDDAVDVNEYVSPQITFNEPMDPSSINTSTIHMERKSDSAPVTASVVLSGDGLTATIDPSSALSTSTEYLISVEYGCTDLAGNNLQTPQTSEFTTQASNDSTPPTVRQVTPANYAADVSAYTGIVVVFSEPIDSSTAHTGTIRLRQAGASSDVLGVVSVASDGLSASFAQSNPPLTKNKDFTITIVGGSSGIKDPAGNALATNVVSVFNSEFKDETDAFVRAVAPGDGATGEPVNIDIILQFSEPLNPASVNSGTVTVTAGATPVSGAVSLLTDGISVKFKPDTDLVANTTYTITTTSSIQDLSGRSATAFASTFTTDAGGAIDSDGPIVTGAVSAGDVDTTLSLTAPFTTDLDRWASIEVTFDEDIDPSTVTLSNFELVRDATSEKVAVRLSITNGSKTIVINPVSLLANDETYTVNLKPGIRNISGYPLQSFTSFGLDTVDTSADVLAPYVTSVTPADNANNVPVDQVITIVFSEPIDPDMAVLGNIAVIKTSGSNPPPKGDLMISLSTDRTTVTITPQVDYQNNKNYEIRIQDVVVDDADNGNDCSSPPAMGSGCDTPSNPTDWTSDFST